MATIINNPGNGEDSSGAGGLLLGFILLIIVLALFFLYGLPMIRNSNTPVKEAPKTDSLDINVTVPKAEVPAQ